MDDDIIEFKPELETKISLWGRVISWIFGGILLIVAFSILMIGSWTFGLSILEEMKAFGLLRTLLTLGVGSLLFLLSGLMIVLFIAIVRRIMKWEWLKIPPME